jgi:hypothetical protein
MRTIYALLATLLLTATAYAAPNGTLAAATAPAPTGGNSGLLTWTPGSNCGVNGVTCGANVYACTGVCTVGSGTWVKLTTTPIANDTGSYTDSAVTVGIRSYYVTDVATGNGWSNTESGASNVATVTFPVPPPTSLVGSHN